MKEYFAQILDHFDLDSQVVDCKRYGQGHINKTYVVLTRSGHRYILQKINNSVFKNVDALMDNIDAITTYLSENTDDARAVMQLAKTVDGKAYFVHEDDTLWRVFHFVEDSICLQSPETADDLYESAVAFGKFQQLLKDFPAHTLHDTIPNFHNTPDRYRIIRQVLEQDPVGRAAGVQDLIDFALAREPEASTLTDLLAQNKLPLRVTHNDTKLNNVMLDANTRKALCVLDLDTVMPGLSLYDFGDAVRFGASTAAEDETDLSKVEMDLTLFRACADGYLSACPDLTPLERQLLPMGAKLMTLECGVRFLTDYLDGDHYFSVAHPTHNLDRCRTQFKLVSDMESKWAQMQDIMESLS